MSGSYTRGERLLFHAVDLAINALSCLLLGLAYLIISFAIFAAATSAYAWYGFQDATVMHQFLRFGGMLLLYLAAPLVAVTCLVIFTQQVWRFIWNARGVFEEKHLHPAFVFLLGVASLMFTYTANVSVSGEWSRLPVQVAEMMEVKPEKGLLMLRRQLHTSGAQSAGGDRRAGVGE